MRGKGASRGGFFSASLRGKAAIVVVLIAGVSVAFLLVDLDGDGLNNVNEIYTYRTSPTNPDSDFDGLTDGDEVFKYRTDPLEKTTFFSGVDEYGDPFTVWNLEFNTPGAGTDVVGLDIVFISENFALDEITRFRELVDDCYRTLLTTEPFSGYKDVINVWRIETAADFEPERPDPDMTHLLVVNGQKVTQFVGDILPLDLDFDPPDDHIVVLVDTPTYGGSGGSPSVAYAGELAVQVAIHEFGHGFGGLGDEYVVYDEDFPSWEEVPWPNVDWDGSKWENIPGTGAYEGAVYRNLVRPTYDGCIMGSILCPGFCPVCEMHLASLLEEIRII